jgi:hypothetical protein
MFFISYHSFQNISTEKSELFAILDVEDMHVTSREGSRYSLVPVVLKQAREVDVVRDWDLGVTSPLKVLQNA